MDTDAHGYHLPSGPLTYEIIACALAVVKEIGHGLHEKPYENGLIVEFRIRRLVVDQQRVYPIYYKGVVVGEFVPDMIVGNEVVVDAKVVDRITDHERGQMINYLRITKLKVGVILNFKKAKLEWERIVL